MIRIGYGMAGWGRVEKVEDDRTGGSLGKVG